MKCVAIGDPIVKECVDNFEAGSLKLLKTLMDLYEIKRRGLDN